MMNSRFLFLFLLVFLMACEPEQKTLSNSSSSGAVSLNETVTVPDDLSAVMHQDSGNVAISPDSGDTPLTRLHVFPTSSSSDSAIRVSSSSKKKAMLQLFNSVSQSGWILGYDAADTSLNKFYIQHSAATKPIMEIYPTPSGTYEAGVKINGQLSVDTMTVTDSLNAAAANIRALAIDVRADATATPAPDPSPVAGGMYADTLYVGSTATVSGQMDVTNDVTVAGNLTMSTGTATVKQLIVTGSSQFTGGLNIIPNPTPTGGQTPISITSTGDFVTKSGSGKGNGWTRFGPDRYVFNSGSVYGSCDKAGSVSFNGVVGLAPDYLSSVGNFVTGGYSLVNSQITGTLNINESATNGGASTFAGSYIISGAVSSPTLILPVYESGGTLTGLTIDTTTGVVGLTCTLDAGSGGAYIKAILDIYVAKP